MLLRVWDASEIFFVELVHHEEYEKEVLNVAQIFKRVVKVAADVMAIGICGNCGNQTQKTINLFVSGVDIFVD